MFSRVFHLFLTTPWVPNPFALFAKGWDRFSPL
jgi:hypothetical protein